MKKCYPYLKNIYKIGLWNIEFDEEEHKEEVTNYLFMKFKIFPIFMKEKEI